jgi:O-antigen ligase
VERFGEGVDQLVRSGSPDPSRAIIWRATARMIRDFPLLGAGLGAYHTVYPSYAESDKLFGLDYSHNDYLQVLADGGALGGIAAISFIVATFSAIRHGIHARDPLLAGLTLAAAAGIFAVLIQSLSDTDVQIPSNALLFLVLSAVVSQIAAIQKENA